MTYTLAHYIEDCQRTKSADKAKATLPIIATNEYFSDILHAVIGMVTEAGEFTEGVSSANYNSRPIDVVNCDEEMGDLMWYVAVYYKARNLPIDFDAQTMFFFKGFEGITLPMVTISCNLLDMFKKHIFYGRSFDLEAADAQVARLVGLVAAYCLMRGRSLESVCKQNIDKLKARYPEKFDAQQALFRDLENERRVLERG